MLPITILLVLIFYIVFENITNIFAEITLFADRLFYDEWWNSSTFEEFNRLWNKPVHNFLFRHVYLECMVKYGLGKKISQLVTFFFSALLHELLFALVFKTVR
jgi:sterol O-acyltransferase